MITPSSEYEAEQRLRALGAVIGQAILEHLDSTRRGVRRHASRLRGLAGDVDGNRLKAPDGSVYQPSTINSQLPS